MSELTPEQKYQQACDMLTIAQVTFNNKTEEEAAELLKQSAEAGYAAAWIRLSQCYYKGIGVDSDRDEAINCVKKAADLGDREALERYAYHLFYKENDHKEAFVYIQKALDNDASGKAHYLLGLLYYHGRGPEQDYDKSYAAHLEAGNRGNIDAMFELYVYYSQGIGCERDPKKAFEWNTKAADLSQPRACYNQGWYYENGVMVEKDLDKAYDYYLAAANGGHGKASAYVGVMLQKGIVKPVLTVDKEGNWKEEKAKKIAESFYREAEEDQGFYEIKEFLKNFGIER
jgi:hypothetical protein